MSEEQRAGGVRYSAVDDGYFEQRSLRRHARVGSLWALGVGAVISGDFFGWNFGLAAGGFGGLLVATGIVTLMYAGLCFSIAEMSPALPHTGGAYSFARTSMGPWAAYITGLAENMEFILTPAVIVVGIGSYLGEIFGTPNDWAPAWWALAYAVFVGLNIVGVETSFRVTVAVTVIALAILAVFFVGALPHLDCSASPSTSPPKPAPAHSFLTVCRASLPPCPSRSGSTWQSKSSRWRPKNRTTRPETCRAASCSLY